jgi:hypothetical protein
MITIKAHQDDKGNISSMRIGFLAMVALLLILLVAWGVVFVYISLKCQAPDYMGLAAILGSLFSIIGTVFLGKAWQKRYEGPSNFPQQKFD